MRIKSKDVFYKRDSHTKTPKSKLFIIFEGTKNELKYFEEFLCKNDVISNVFFFIRDKDKEGWTNPKKIMDMLILVMNGQENIYYTYDSIFENFYEYILNFSNLFSKKFIKNKYLGIVNKIVGNIHLPIEIEQLKNIMNTFFKEFIDIETINFIVDENYLKDLIENVSTFDSDIDKIALVVDRDKKSFTEEQYDYVLKKSKDLNIDFYVINPCFEFWLLLHWNDCTQYTKNELFENELSVTGNTFVYTELKKFDCNYNKSKFNAKYYVANVDKAIKNSDFFETNIAFLKQNIGTNLKFLIQKLRSKKESS